MNNKQSAQISTSHCKLNISRSEALKATIASQTMLVYINNKIISIWANNVSCLFKARPKQKEVERAQLC